MSVSLFKVRVLNLDITFNSDFSQAEIDDEIVNLQGLN